MGSNIIKLLVVQASLVKSVHLLYGALFFQLYSSVLLDGSGSVEVTSHHHGTHITLDSSKVWVNQFQLPYGHS